MHPMSPRARVDLTARAEESQVHLKRLPDQPVISFTRDWSFVLYRIRLIQLTLA
jgi:hypothetical protein